jgi:hypothetical protein
MKEMTMDEVKQVSGGVPLLFWLLVGSLGGCGAKSEVESARDRARERLEEAERRATDPARAPQ